MTGLAGMTTAGDAVMAAGDLVLRLGEQDRVTFHPDRDNQAGGPESVTTHTVMLVVVACALAADIDGLDVGLVAQYAAVHDLPEARAGDTSTLRALTPEQAADKAAREQAAEDHILMQFVYTMPWIAARLHSYGQQVAPEARFVRAVDKLLPKILHILNRCRSLLDEGITPEEIRDRYLLQRSELAEYSAEWPIIAELHTDLVGRVLDIYGATFDEAAAR